MPLRDVIAAALSRPAGKIVDGPVRDIINEILAERGYASPAEVGALRDEADALRAQLDTLQTTVEGISDQLSQLQGQLTTLQKAPAAAPASATDHSLLVPAVPAAPATPLAERAAEVVASTGRGDCKADDCGVATWRDGFCVSHAEAWRAGRLPGFVSPEGLVSVSGQPRRIAPGFSGALYTVESGQVRVGEQLVPSVAY
ncbi:MAG: hypothetical protein ACI8S6_002865 [Myxococcota bacterium]|jgi:hypothetical protein